MEALYNNTLITVLIYSILFILGTCFGSFSTVLISRWHSGQGGIFLGRSMCPHCKKTLTVGELIPIVSWIFQLGRCRQCNIPISKYYPISEIIIGLIFVFMGVIAERLGIGVLSFTMLILLFWGFTTIIYIIYDLLYMEIPDQMLVPAILVTAGLLILGYTIDNSIFFFDYSTYPTFHTFLTDHIYGALLVYNFFFLQILIPGTYYLISKGNIKDSIGLLMSYITFPIILIGEFLRIYKPDDNPGNPPIPTWIGGGDLRIGIFIGITLGTVHSISTLIFAYLIGSVVGIGILIFSKIQGRHYSHEIPFGPFLGIGWFLSLFLYNDILDYISLISK